MSVVVAFDASSMMLGFAVAESNPAFAGNRPVLTCGAYRLGKDSTPLSRRLVEARFRVIDTISRHQPGIAVVEAPVLTGRSSMKTILACFGVIGVVMEAIARANPATEIRLVAPSWWQSRLLTKEERKTGLTGPKGKAELKARVKAKVLESCPHLAPLMDSYDASDAAAIAKIFVAHGSELV